MAVSGKTLPAAVPLGPGFPQAPGPGDPWPLSTRHHQASEAGTPSDPVGTVSIYFCATPTAVPGAPAFDRITAGWGYTCALTPAGQGYCWGKNDYGQLAIGGTTAPFNPGNNAGVFQPTPVSGGLRFTSIEAGYLHTCGVTPELEVYCWGANFDGRLGLGTRTPFEPAPGLVAEPLR